MSMNFTKEETEWLESIGGTFTNEDDKWLCKIQGGQIRIIVEKIPLDRPYMGTIGDEDTQLEFIYTGRNVKKLVSNLLKRYLNDAQIIANAAVDAEKLLETISIE